MALARRFPFWAAIERSATATSSERKWSGSGGGGAGAVRSEVDVSKANAASLSEQAAVPLAPPSNRVPDV